MTSEAFDQATQPPSLRQRLSDAMALIGGIRKDKKNPHGKYEYLSEEAVKRAVQDALISQRLVPEPEPEILAVREVKSSNGGMRLLYDVKCTIVIRDGDEEVRAIGLGSGIDHSDKALTKAQTAAIREAWKNLFCIPSGTDPEAYPDEPRSNEPSTTQEANPEQKPADTPDLSKLTAIRKELGLTSGQVSQVAAKRFGLKVGQMSAKDVDALWGFLGQMSPEVLEEVMNDDLSSIQKAGE